MRTVETQQRRLAAAVVANGSAKLRRALLAKTVLAVQREEAQRRGAADRRADALQLVPVHLDGIPVLRAHDDLGLALGKRLEGLLGRRALGRHRGECTTLRMTYMHLMARAGSPAACGARARRDATRCPA